MEKQPFDADRLRRLHCKTAFILHLKFLNFNIFSHWESGRRDCSSVFIFQVHMLFISAHHGLNRLLHVCMPFNEATFLLFRCCTALFSNPISFTMWIFFPPCVVFLICSVIFDFKNAQRLFSVRASLIVLFLALYGKTVTVLFLNKSPHRSLVASFYVSLVFLWNIVSTWL